MNTSNSLSNSSADLALGRAGLPAFGLAARAPREDRGALVRIGPVLGDRERTLPIKRRWHVRCRLFRILVSSQALNK